MADDPSSVLVQLQLAADQFDAALDRAQASFKQTLAGMDADARESGEDIHQAFAALGVQSLDDIRYKITALQQAFETLRSSGKVSADDIGRAETALQQKIAALKAELRGVHSASDISAAGLRDAFGVVGVRSLSAIQAEIHTVEIALQRLGADAKVSGADFDRAWAAGNRKIKALQAEMQGVSAQMGGMNSGASGLMSSFKGLAGVFGAMEIGREFLQANIAMENMQRTLNQITGSAKATQAEIQWLREVSDRLGISFADSARAYAGLMAAAKGTAMEGQQARDVFIAVANASAKLGLSAEETSGSLLAIQQMISKGKVSMEEFRQQLSERLPGAMQATAKELGVTVAELDKMISSGNVMSADMLPALAAGLNKMYGTDKIDGTVSSWNRLKNAVNETFQFLGETGVMDAVAKALGAVTIAVKELAVGLSFVGRLFGTQLGALLNFDFSHPIRSMENFRDAMTDLLTDTWDKAKKAFNGTGAAASAAAQKMDGAADTARASGAKASDAGQKWLSLTNAYTKVSEAADKDAEIAKKNAEARQQQTTAAVNLANAFGTQYEKHVAATNAALANAQALQVAAQATQHQADLANQYAKDLQAVVDQEGAADKAHTAAAQKAAQNAQAKQAEADKSAAAALVEQQHAAQLQVETAALADNSAKVTELRAAYETATAALAAVSAARKDGNATLEAERAAQIEAGKAAALYRDALADTTAAIQAKSNAAQAANDLDQAEISLALQVARDEEELAEKTGDVRGAIEAKNRVVRLEIQLSEAKAKAARLEADAQLQLVAAKRAELLAANQLTPAKEAELQAQEAGAKVKQLEAKMADEAATHLREMADAEQAAADASTNAQQSMAGNTSTLDGMSDSADRAAESMQNLADVQSGMSAGGGNSGGSGGGGAGGGGGSGGGRPPSGGQQEDPNTVTRKASVYNLDTEQIGRENGVKESDLSAFSQSFGTEMQKNMEKMMPKMHIMGTQEYMQRWNSAFLASVADANSDAKKANRQTIKRTDETVKVELTLPTGQKATVTAANRSAADEFLEQLKNARGTSTV